MGTFGHKILEDDFAQEIRGIYLDKLFLGISNEEATSQLLNDYQNLDIDENSVFWLALAYTQNEYGRLTEIVKNEAIKIIDSGEDLKKWHFDTKRKKELEKLKLKLLNEQPKIKKLINRKPVLKEGDVFRFPIDKIYWGFGRVITELERAIYNFKSDNKNIDLEEILRQEIAFIVCSNDRGFYNRKWKVIGNKPLEYFIKKPFYFYHQSVGNKVCRVFDMWKGDNKYIPMFVVDCREIEQWGVWNDNHIIDRLSDCLINKEFYGEGIYKIKAINFPQNKNVIDSNKVITNPKIRSLHKF